VYEGFGGASHRAQVGRLTDRRARQMRKLTSLAAAAILTLGLVAPASAAPPERGEEFIWTILLDQEHDLVAFWNMSREAFCEWEASDFDGDPPVDHLIPFKLVFEPSGAMEYHWGDAAPLELWSVNEDAPLTSICEDIDGSPSLWATGSATSGGTDNDLDHAVSVENGLQRTDSYGEHANGSVTDGDGQTWRYNWTFRAVFDNDLEYREVVPLRTVLAPGG
jgi:hypothetical protein